MNTKEILSIVALAALGLCLLCCLAKAAMKKGDKGKNHCDKACGAFVFLAIILLAVSQLMGEKEKFGDNPLNNCTRVTGPDFKSLDCCPLGGCTENKPACNGSGGDWWCYTTTQKPDSNRTKPCCRDYKYDNAGNPILPVDAHGKRVPNTGLCGGTDPNMADIGCAIGHAPSPLPPQPTPTPAPSPIPNQCTVDGDGLCNFPMSIIDRLNLKEDERTYLREIPTKDAYWCKGVDGTSCCSAIPNGVDGRPGCCDPTNPKNGTNPQLPGQKTSGGDCMGADPVVLPCCTPYGKPYGNNDTNLLCNPHNAAGQLICN
jgi:hypothetical protein